MTLSRLATLILAAATFSLTAADPKKVASVEGITEYQLDNGLRVLIFPDNSQSKVTVNMTVLVGSRQEGYGETGMAHLLEHMVFKGTPTHPKIPKELQDHGAQFNGSTSVDRVNYYETLSASDENLEFAISMEADRLVNSTIKKEDLESEMTVVRNEFERGENSPQGVLMKRIEAAAYEWHNYGKPTIGNRSDIERVPVENLRAFYKKFYQPDNIVLIVAGKLDEKKTLGLVQKYFGAIPRPTRVLDTTWTEEPAQDGERAVTLRRVGDAGYVCAAYHIPAGSHEDFAALQVLGNILDTEPSGRLYKALVETHKAASAGAGAQGEHDPGLMFTVAELTKDGSLDDVKDILLATTEKIGESGVTTEEVNRAKQQILKQREQAAADTARVALSLSEWVAQGDWRLYFLYRDRIEKVTPEAVKDVAARYLTRNNRTVGVFIPTEKSERATVPPSPDINALVSNYKGRAPISEGEVFDATPANVEGRAQRQELPDGINVTLLPKKTRGEEVRVMLTLRFGDEENLKGYETALSFLPEMMLRGTKKLDFQQLRDELDRLKATLNGGSGGGGRGRGRGGGANGAVAGVTFTIQAKRETLPDVLLILKQVLREPTFPADQFEIIKRERLANLEQALTEPSALAPRALQRELNPYPKEDVRYTPTMEESIQRLKDVTLEQVTKLHKEYLGSHSGELTIVGQFDAEPCLNILKDTLKGWAPAKPYARVPTTITREAAGLKDTINTPDKENATYVAGLLMPVRDDDPDYPALLMGNYILGGSGTLSSRLGNRVRQKEGLTYGISSGLNISSFDKRAAFSITAICNPKNIARVEQCVQEEVEKLLKDGIPQEELDQARQGWLQGEKVSRSSDAALMGILSSLTYTGRTMMWDADLEKKIEALTPEQVVAALRKYIDPKKLVIVTAGDFGTKAATK